MENFAQTLKQALFNNEAFTKSLSKYRAKVRILSKSSNKYLVNDVIDIACVVLTDILRDVEMHRDIMWELIYDCDTNYLDAMSIECQFYQWVGGSIYEHCYSLIQTCYFMDNNVRYGNVVMLDQLAGLGTRAAMKEDMQLMKKYLYIFRNVLFEIISEIHPEMEYIKI